MKCVVKGCSEKAEWEVEIIDDPPHGKLFFFCPMHCPDPRILHHTDSIKRIP